MMAGFFWFSLGMIAYVYLGYPAMLYCIALILPEKKVKKAAISPSVTLIISVFNEEAVLDDKLKNALALVYPKEKLEILVVSDASSDRSDEIARKYQSEGVRLLRMPERGGKTLGLNVAVREAVGEIVVFSDANAMYQTDALEKLARNFADPEVGYATGESRYLISEDSSVSAMENLYWTYEINIKKLESQLGSMVGADGAIYAIRKKLYEALQATDINDFVNPLQVIAKGYRGVYEEDAVCYEETAASFGGEFRRRVRIINRSWRGLFRVSQLLNPIRFGFYSIELISHKLLRWLVPVMMWTAFLSNVMLYAESALYKVILGLQLSFVFMALVGAFFSYLNWKGKFFFAPYYICLANIASLIGIYRGIRGRSQVVWNPDRKEEGPESSLPTSKALLWPIFVTIGLSLLFVVLIFGSDFFALISFWSAGFLVLFANAGYLLLLLFFSACFRRSVDKKSCFPTVTLLVAAFNEAGVIEKKIENSLAIDYPKDKLKIIIASDGSSDATNHIIRKYEEQGICLYPYSPRRGKITVLNRTMPSVTSEITVLSDANTMYHPLAIQKLVRNFSDADVGVVSGNVIIRNDDKLLLKSEGLYYKIERFIQKKETEIGCMVGVDGAMYAIRTKLFMPPSENIILDDLVISMNIAKQGYRIVYEPEAIALESNSTGIKGEFKRKVRVVAGGIQAIKQQEGVPHFFEQSYLSVQYFIHKFLRWLMPVFLGVLFISNIVLLDESNYLIFFAGQVTFYVLSMISVFIDAKDKGFLSIPFYFCLVNLAAFVGIIKGLANLQPVTWEKVERHH